MLSAEDSGFYTCRSRPPLIIGELWSPSPPDCFLFFLRAKRRPRSPSPLLSCGDTFSPNRQSHINIRQHETYTPHISPNLPRHRMRQQPPTPTSSISVRLLLHHSPKGARPLCARQKVVGGNAKGLRQCCCLRQRMAQGSDGPSETIHVRQNDFARWSRCRRGWSTRCHGF